MNKNHESITSTLMAIYANDYYPTVKAITGSSTTPEVIIDGRNYVNFGSNSYLGIATHPRIIEAARSGLDLYGAGSGASRLTAGTTDAHVELEGRIAKLKGTEGAVLFSTGTHANNAGIAALMGLPLQPLVKKMARDNLGYSTKTTLILDHLVHASIVDGGRLAQAMNLHCQVLNFKHNDIKSLERSLGMATSENIVIAVDGLYSLHGDIAPIDKMCALAAQYNARLYVDDAHATGVLGRTGKGTTELFGVEGQVDYQMGTFSKALGCQGGFIAGDAAFCAYLRVAARPYMFQTSMPPALALACTAAIDIVEQEPQHLLNLRLNTQHLHQRLLMLGYNTLGSTTQVIPILIGKEDKVKRVEHGLEEAGIFAPIYYYPAVQPGAAIIRINVMASHTQSHLDRLIDALQVALPIESREEVLAAA